MTNIEYAKERYFVDATPDEGYPLRILQAYRRDADFLASSSTMGIDETNPLIKQMNDDQRKRAEILDRAIETLTQPKHCTIWLFQDAPEEYRELSKHGGDEDYVVFIPDGLYIWPFEMDDSYVMGWGHVERYEHEVEGGQVIIFAHA